MNIPAAYKRVGGAWDGLLHNVAFPLMAFNDEDARLWAEDPQEYIRKVGAGWRGRGRSWGQGEAREWCGWGLRN